MKQSTSSNSCPKGSISASFPRVDSKYRNDPQAYGTDIVAPGFKSFIDGDAKPGIVSSGDSCAQLCNQIAGTIKGDSAYTSYSWDKNSGLCQCGTSWTNQPSLKLMGWDNSKQEFILPNMGCSGPIPDEYIPSKLPKNKNDCNLQRNEAQCMQNSNCIWMTPSQQKIVSEDGSPVSWDPGCYEDDNSSGNRKHVVCGETGCTSELKPGPGSDWDTCLEQPCSKHEVPDQQLPTGKITDECTNFDYLTARVPVSCHEAAAEWPGQVMLNMESVSKKGGNYAAIITPEQGGAATCAKLCEDKNSSYWTWLYNKYDTTTTPPEYLINHTCWCGHEDIMASDYYKGNTLSDAQNGNFGCTGILPTKGTNFCAGRDKVDCTDECKWIDVGDDWTAGSTSGTGPWDPEGRFYNPWKKGDDGKGSPVYQTCMTSKDCTSPTGLGKNFIYPDSKYECHPIWKKCVSTNYVPKSSCSLSKTSACFKNS